MRAELVHALTECERKKAELEQQLAAEGDPARTDYLAQELKRIEYHRISLSDQLRKIGMN